MPVNILKLNMKSKYFKIIINTHSMIIPAWLRNYINLENKLNPQCNAFSHDSKVNSL